MSIITIFVSKIEQDSSRSRISYRAENQLGKNNDFIENILGKKNDFLQEGSPLHIGKICQYKSFSE